MTDVSKKLELIKKIIRTDRLSEIRRIQFADLAFKVGEEWFDVEVMRKSAGIGKKHAYKVLNDGWKVGLLKRKNNQPNSYGWYKFDME